MPAMCAKAASASENSTPVSAIHDRAADLKPCTVNAPAPMRRMSIAIAIVESGGRGRPGNTKGFLPRPVIWSPKRRKACSLSGTSCGFCIFIRAPGTTHVALGNEISSHVACKVSLVRAQVRIVNISARDAVVLISASRVQKAGNSA